MSSKRIHEGELTIDNRFGPGVDAAFIRRAGKDAPAVGEGQLYESGTAMCAHCGTVVVLNPNRTRPRGYCRKCDRYLCDNPACSLDCVPFMKRLEDAQNRAYHEAGLIIPGR